MIPLPRDLFSDPRFLNLSSPAMALITRAASWSAAHLTDGHIPASALPLLGCADDGPEVAALLAEGLWKPGRRDGYQFVDWPSSERRDSVERRRAMDRQRKRRKRQMSRSVSAPDTDADTENPSTTPVLSGADTHADTDAGAQDGDSGDAGDSGDPDHQQNTSSQGVLTFDKLSGADTAADPSALPAKSPTGTWQESPTGTLASFYGKSKDFPQRPAKTEINKNEPGEINTGSIVAAWVDAYRNLMGIDPGTRKKAQVGREVRQLLNANADPALVLEAATQAAEAGGFATVTNQYGPLKAQRTKVRVTTTERRDPKTGRCTDDLPW